MGRKKREEEWLQKTEELIAGVLSHIILPDEKVLWRGRVAERVVKKAESLIKIVGIMLAGAFAVWVIILIISLIRSDYEIDSSLMTSLLLFVFPFFLPILLFGSVKEEEENDYFITSKKIIKINNSWKDGPYITMVDLDKIDEVLIQHRFGKWVEFFMLRDNKRTRAIRQIYFYSDYLATHPEECRLMLIDGHIVAQDDADDYLKFEGDWELFREYKQEYSQIDKKSKKKGKEKSNLLSFPFLDGWKKAKEILKELIFEKF